MSHFQNFFSAFNLTRTSKKPSQKRTKHTNQPTKRRKSVRFHTPTDVIDWQLQKLGQGLPLVELNGDNDSFSIRTIPELRLEGRASSIKIHNVELAHHLGKRQQTYFYALEPFFDNDVIPFEIAGFLREPPEFKFTRNANQNDELGNVLCCALSADAKIAVTTCSRDHDLKISNLETGEILKSLHGHEKHIRDIVVSHDGLFIISVSSDQHVKMWNFQTGELIKTFNGHDSPVASCALSKDDTLLATGDWEGNVKIWDIESGTELVNLNESWSRVTSCAFSNDNEFLVSGHGRAGLNIWDLKTQTLVQNIDGEVECCAFASDNSFVVGSSGNDVKLWNLNGEEKCTLAGHRNEVLTCALASDDSFLVTASRGGVMKIWNLDTYEVIQTLHGHGKGITCSRLSNDDEKIISCCWDHTVKIWECSNLPSH